MRLLAKVIAFPFMAILFAMTTGCAVCFVVVAWVLDKAGWTQLWSDDDA